MVLTEKTKFFFALKNKIYQDTVNADTTNLFVTKHSHEQDYRRTVAVAQCLRCLNDLTLAMLQMYYLLFNLLSKLL